MSPVDGNDKSGLQGKTHSWVVKEAVETASLYKTWEKDLTEEEKAAEKDAGDDGEEGVRFNGSNFTELNGKQKRKVYKRCRRVHDALKTKN